MTLWLRIALSRFAITRRLMRQVVGRWPMPDDLDRMSRRQLDAYIRVIGLDARIKAALREEATGGLDPDPRHVPEDAR